MKTKLVYVLTCSADDNYIEQALMSIYSARYRNPDSYIVLITDDLTDRLLSGSRSVILTIITEKIVVPFEDKEVSMRYRSRWIKTYVRELIDGDYLFIDCDTIIQRSLSAIDDYPFLVGAVPESLLKVNEFCTSLYEYTKEKTQNLGVDLDQEGFYYNSGVMYVKDAEETHQLYRLWHQYWKDGVDGGMYIDQPALSKANRDCGHIIHTLNDEYNYMLWTRASRTEEASILHISSYRNPSLLFSKRVLRFVEEYGLDNEWLRKAILNPCSTFLPFDNQVYHSSRTQRKRWCKEISTFLRGYGSYIDPFFTDFPMHSRFRKAVVWLLHQRHIKLGLSFWLHWKYMHLHLKKEDLPDNICRK